SPGKVVISPLPVGMALAMALAGAAGETAAEMAHALGLAGEPADLSAANADLLRHYGAGDAANAPRLRLANALVLTKHGEAVAQAYRDLLADRFAAEIFAGDLVSL